MKAKSLFLFALLVIAIEIPAIAGKFSGWSGPFKVDVRVPEPPEAYIGKKSVRLSVINAPPAIATDQMRALIEQALAPDIAVTETDPEASFKVNVINYEPPLSRQYTLSERMQVKVGDRQLYNKDGTPQKIFGTPVTEPVYEERDVAVQYWEGKGRLSVTVEVQSATGATLDAFKPQAILDQKIKLSIGNESTPEAGHVPDERDMVHILAAELAAQIRKRYSTTEHPDVILLAIDDELKAGNAMARAGKWDDALKQWESASMKKNSSDRIYNMAAANEMLAYAKYRDGHDMQSALPFFTKSMDLYQQALQADPKEKYIQQSQARIMRAKAGMESALKQYEAQKFQADQMAQEIADRQKEDAAIQNMIADGENGQKSVQTPDSPMLAKYRTYVRAHLSNEPADPSDQQKEAILSSAKDLYGIEGEDRKRIFYEEIGRKHKHDKGIRLYRENLAEFSKDKRLDPDERAILSDISNQYSLTSAETGRLEQEFGVASVVPHINPAPHVIKKQATVKPSQNN